MKTKVINIRSAPDNWQADPQYVYIGRAGKGLSGKWGNPFTVAEHGLGRALQKYRQWIIQPEQRRLREEARVQLKGKTLICFCKDRNGKGPCHGDVLAWLADR